MTIAVLSENDIVENVIEAEYWFLKEQDFKWEDVSNRTDIKIGEPIPELPEPEYNYDEYFRGFYEGMNSN